jgi:hypothetical protein
MNDYKRNNISLGQLVNSLEGSINALEEKLPEEFYKIWYSYWGNLEITLALGIEIQAQNDISEDLEELEKIITKQLLE